MFTRLLKVVGAGSVLGLSVLSVPFTATASDKPETPAGWYQLTPQQRLMAKRAAEMDAYRLMAERIGGLKITTHTGCANLATISDRVGSRMSQFLKGVRLCEPQYYADGSCEVDAQVSLAEVIAFLKKSIDEDPKASPISKASLDDTLQRNPNKILVVTGCGAPPAPPRSAEPVTERPTWNARDVNPKPISLPSIYRDHAPVERLKAKRAAELDGYRKLVESINGLPVNSNSSVGDLVTRDDCVRSAVEGSLRFARTTNVCYRSDGIVEVDMEVPVEQVVTVVTQTYGLGDEATQEITRRTEHGVVTARGTGALDVGGSSDLTWRIVESTTPTIDR
jgi:hypothetical protein